MAITHARSTLPASVRQTAKQPGCNPPSFFHKLEVLYELLQAAYNLGKVIFQWKGNLVDATIVGKFKDIVDMNLLYTVKFVAILFVLFQETPKMDPPALKFIIANTFTDFPSCHKAAIISCINCHEQSYYYKL